MTELKHLFAPGAIGKMQLKNRVVMAPMGTANHLPGGEMNPRTVDYYAARAKGGVGLIICQSTLILRESRAPGRLSNFDDKYIPGLKKAADAIHANGSKCAMQVVHHGRLLTDYKKTMPNPEEVKDIAPSAISRLMDIQADTKPQEATQEDIQRIVEGFAEAAVRIQKAGFDAVEIHGGHGYLISQFLSPLANRRVDEYGGSPVNRARFACEVIAAVRSKVGPDYPVLFRFSGSDFLPGGISIEDSVLQAPMFEAAGADALHVSACEQASADTQFPGFLYPQGSLVSLAEAVKKAVTIPVITVGKIYDPEFADGVLAEGKADYVALGRQMFADPEWAQKAREGRVKDIRFCIYCLNCMNTEEHPEIRQSGMHCAINPNLLRENDAPAPLPEKKKNVMVVGGGTAGMEAALTCAERGHEVTLYEQNSSLGGQWKIAAAQPQKAEDYSRLLEYYAQRLNQSKVNIHLNSHVTIETIKHVNPNTVVLATGAVADIPNVNIISEKILVQANEVILKRAEVGDRVIVLGGRYMGMELADQLADEGKKVTLVTRSALGRKVERHMAITLRNRLIAKGVYIHQNCPVVEIRENGVYVIYNGQLMFLEGDTVILAMGVKPVRELQEKLAGSACEVFEIGDCVSPRDLMFAIREGYETGLMI